MTLITTLLNAFGILTGKQKEDAAKKAASTAKRSQAQKDAWARKKAQLNRPL